MAAGFLLPRLIQLSPPRVRLSAATIRNPVGIANGFGGVAMDTLHAAAKAAALTLGLSLAALFVGLALAMPFPH